MISINPSAIQLTQNMYPSPELMVDAIASVCYHRDLKSKEEAQVFSKGLLQKEDPHLTPFEFVPVYFKEIKSDLIQPALSDIQGCPISYVEFEEGASIAVGATSFRTVLDFLAVKEGLAPFTIGSLILSAVSACSDYNGILPERFKGSFYPSISTLLDVSFLPFPENVKTRVVTVLFTTSRRVSHQLVRHRRMKLMQESQRYVRYNHLEVIKSEKLQRSGCSTKAWEEALISSLRAYNDLLSSGLPPQEARDVLPNCTATRLAMSGTLKEWAWVLHLRCSRGADPETRRLMIPLRERMISAYPILTELLAEAKERYARITDTGTAS